MITFAPRRSPTVKRPGLSLTLLVIGVLLTGCVPRERFWWAPDGSVAAVMTGGQLRFVDPDGEFLDLSGLDATSPLIQEFAWHPDSKRWIVSRIDRFPDWDSFRDKIDGKDRERIESLAEVMPSILRAAIAAGGDADHLEPFLGRVSAGATAHYRNAFFLACERDGDEVAGILQSVPVVRQTAETVAGGENAFLLHALEIRSIDEAVPPKTPYRGIRGITGLELSPDGTRLAFGCQEGEPGLVSLCVLDIESESSPVRKLFENTRPAFTWSATEPEVLYFLQPATGRKGLIHRLHRVTVPGDPDAPPAFETLATSLTPFSSRLESLPDGGVLFASQPVSWPAPETDSPPEAFLYRIDPGAPVPRRVPSPRGALPMNLGYFVVSPDGEHAAVVESDTDALAVVGLASGAVNLISPPHPGWKCRTLPAWRGNDELTFAALDETGGRIHWISRSITEGEHRILNLTWPAAATSDWLEHKKRAAENSP